MQVQTLASTMTYILEETVYATLFALVVNFPFLRKFKNYVKFLFCWQILYFLKTLQHFCNIR